jgi:hypothetical protein
MGRGAEPAAALVALHEEERGVQLFGAAASLLEELAFGFHDEGEERMRDRAVADAKASLGEEAFAAVWACGEAITPDALLASAPRLAKTSRLTLLHD